MIGAWGAAILLAAQIDLAVARERLQKELDRWREQVKAPGAVAAIVGADGEGAAVASGLARKEPAIAMKPTDRMLAGSVGKTYVAAVALQLVDEEKLELDAKISTWLAPAEEWFERLPNHDSITLRQLMNHTSGLPEYFDQPGALKLLGEQPQKTWSPVDRLAFVLDRPPLFAAGEGWSYADTNYIVVGVVIERVTGRAFYAECRERLLGPLELLRTEPSDRPDLPGLVSGYTTKGRPFPFPDEVAQDGTYCANPQFEWTGGGFIADALDLARWARLLFGTGEVLPEDLRTQMMEGVAARLTPGEEYGLGCTIRDTALGPAVGHSGWFPGYLTDVAWFPDAQLAIALQTNTDRGVPLPRQHAFLDAAAAAVVAK